MWTILLEKSQKLKDWLMILLIAAALLSTVCGVTICRNNQRPANSITVLQRVEYIYGSHTDGVHVFISGSTNILRVVEGRVVISSNSSVQFSSSCIFVYDGIVLRLVHTFVVPNLKWIFVRSEYLNWIDMTRKLNSVCHQTVKVKVK